MPVVVPSSFWLLFVNFVVLLVATQWKWHSASFAVAYGLLFSRHSVLQCWMVAAASVLSVLAIFDFAGRFSISTWVIAYLNLLAVEPIRCN